MTDLGTTTAAGCGLPTLQRWDALLADTLEPSERRDLCAHLGRGCPRCLQALEAVDPDEQELVLGLLWADAGGSDSAAPTLDAARLDRAVEQGLAGQIGAAPGQATQRADNVVPLPVGRTPQGRARARLEHRTGRHIKPGASLAVDGAVATPEAVALPYREGRLDGASGGQRRAGRRYGYLIGAPGRGLRAALGVAGLAAAAAILIALMPGRWGNETPGGAGGPGSGADPLLAPRGNEGGLGPSFELSVVTASGDNVPLLAGDRIQPGAQVAWAWANPRGRFTALRVSVCEGASEQRCSDLAAPRLISRVGPDEDSPAVEPVRLAAKPGSLSICGTFSPPPRPGAEPGPGASGADGPSARPKADSVRLCTPLLVTAP